MRIVQTFEAKIYVGLRPGYNTTVKKFSPKPIEEYLQGYCDKEGFAFSLTNTRFIYTGGNEPGVVVGIINSPRFPESVDRLRSIALKIAEHLRVIMSQERVFVVFPDETVLVEGGE